MMNLTRMRWTRHVASIGIQETHIVFWWKIQTEREHWEDLDVVVKDNIKMDVIWTGLIWLEVKTSGGLL
jgi:hypothetical protein